MIQAKQLQPGSNGQVLKTDSGAASWQDQFGGVGVNKKVAFWTAADTLASAGNLEWDNSTSILTITGTHEWKGIAAPAVSGAGDGRIYFDSTANKFKVSENGGGYVDLVGGSTPGGVDTNVQFNESGALGGDSEFTWDTSTKALRVTGTVNCIKSGAGANNAYYGVNAGSANAGALRNVIIGDSASPTGGSSFTDNVVVGYQAGVAMGAGCARNTLLGTQAGVTLSSNATDNVYIGYQAAGSANTGDDDNIAIGYRAGYQIDNVGNIMVGYEAGYNNIGPYNIFVGYQAGYMQGVDFSNYTVGIGYRAMYSADSGVDYSVIIGFEAGYDLTGNNNVALGANSMSAATSASGNACMGFNSGDGITTGDNNVFAGSGAGSVSVGSGSENVGVGRNTFQCTGTGSAMLGAGNATNITSVHNYSVVVGYASMRSAGTKTDAIAIGRNAGDAFSTVTGAIAIGYQALLDLQTSDYTIGIGYLALENLTGTANVGIGYKVGSNLVAHENNTIMGYDAMGESVGSNNVIMGCETARGNSSFTKTDSVIIGYRADYYVGASSRTTAQCVAIGFNALYGNTQTGTTDRSGNVAIGYQSLYESDSCDYVTATGHLSGYSITTGSYNTLYGYQSGYDVVTTTYQVLVGANAQLGSAGANFAVVLGSGDSGTTYANPQATAQGAVAIGAGTVVTVADIASIGARGFDMVGRAAPALSAAGEGRIYFDSSSNTFKVSENNGAYVDLVTSSTSPGGADTNVQFNNAGAFGGSADLTWDGSTLYVNGKFTVTGNIDPKALILDGADDEVYIEFDNGNTVAVAGAGKARIRYNDTDKVLEWSADGAAWTAFGSESSSSSSSATPSIGGLDWAAHSSAYEAVNLDGILANTSGGAWELTLPLSPSLGDTIGLMDVYGTFADNNLTVNRNGEKIMGLAENLVCDVDDVALQFIYTGSDKGWKFLSYLQQGSADATPGGANTNIQYNDNGSFGGSSALTWDGSVLGVDGLTEFSSQPGADYAPGGKGRIRYNDDAKQFEASMDGSEWMPFGPAASSSSSSSGLGTITDARKYIQTIGNGVSTTFNVQHNLGTEQVVVQIWETGGSRELVTVDVEVVNEDVVRITFASAPSSGEYDAVVVG